MCHVVADPRFNKYNEDLEINLSPMDVAFALTFLVSSGQKGPKDFFYLLPRTLKAKKAVYCSVCANTIIHTAKIHRKRDLKLP